MQILGVSLLCVVPARGGNQGGRPRAVAARAAGSGLGTPGIWAEWGDMGGPRTLVLPEMPRRVEGAPEDLGLQRIRAAPCPLVRAHVHTHTHGYLDWKQPGGGD